MFRIFKNKKGTTFIELIFYIAIFLVITPTLLYVALAYLKAGRSYDVEKEVNSESRLVAERVYDFVTDAKRVDLENSILDDVNGKLTLIMQDNSQIVIALNPETDAIDITEDGVTDNLTSPSNKVQQLYFEKSQDVFNNENIVLGINIRMTVTGQQEEDIDQEYVLSANLDRGDYDDDGCPDYIDLYPEYSECCGDADVDGTCDEMDNCVLAYNPYQEDYDEDGIGDACDSSTFFGGGGDGGEGGAAFNCTSDDQVLDLLDNNPPLPTWVLKQILISSSPLSPVVLQALIDAHPLLSNNHFAMVMSINTKLEDEIYNNIMAMTTLPDEYKDWIAFAQSTSEWIAWLGFNKQIYTDYDVTFRSDAPPEETWVNSITYSNATDPLCSSGTDQRADLFMISVENGTDSVTVITTTASGSATEVLSTENNDIINSQGYELKLNDIVDDDYALMIDSGTCTEDLISVEFDFGANANITSPSPPAGQREVSRFTSYCGGGCAYNCGDVGSGIVTSYDGTPDMCYKAGGGYPEWCSAWFAFIDDDVSYPPYMGGTQSGEETLYWEKVAESILTEEQLVNLHSITVGGEIAYQNITQFFCDTMGSSCPMEGDLVGQQEVQLYNFETSSWVTIGYLNTDGSISDQQVFEVLYDGSDLLDYVEDGTNIVRARMEFHWDGEDTGGGGWWWWGGGSSPCFMLIDYFTVHLKW